MRALALLLAALAIPAWAADNGDMQAPREFCAEARSTVDYDQCSADELAHAQADLQAVLTAASNKWKDSPETIDALRKSQDAWKALLELDLQARFAANDVARARGEWVGTAYTSAHNWYQASLVRQRTGQLCEFLRGAAYGERSREPCEKLVQAALAPAKN